MTRVVVIDPDESLAATVEALLHRDTDLEVYCAAALDDAWDTLGTDGVLVAGPSLANRRGVEALRAVHRRAPAVRVVLAFDRRPGASMRDVVAIGAEALVDPAETPTLRAALERVVRTSRELVPLTQLTAPEQHPGKFVTVASATGGCGKTFVAGNLGASLAAWAGIQVVLVDLDLQFGEVAASLGMRPRHGWGDLVGVPAEDISTFVDEALVRHSSGMQILAAPTDPGHADRISGPMVEAVLDHLRQHYDVVIVDTSTGLSEATLAAIDRSDELIVMSLLDVASIRNLRTLDRTLDRLDVPISVRSLVLNKDRTGVGLTADEVEKALDRAFLARIPYSDDVLRSMNNGRSVVLDHPGADLLTSLVDVIVSVAPEEQRAELDAHRPVPRRRWFARRRVVHQTTPVTAETTV